MNDRLRLLMIRYLDGGLAAEEADELSASVKHDPAARRAMAELSVQEVHLVRLGREEEPDVAPLRRRPSMGSTSRIGLRKGREPGARPALLAISIAAAALGAVALAVALLSTRRDPAPEQAAVAPAEVAEERAPVPAVPRIPDLPAPPEKPAPAPKIVSAPPAPPPPAPEKQPEPPRKARVAPPPAVREIAIARIERVQGDVSLLSGPLRKPAQAGQSLAWGQGLETPPKDGAAVVKYPDGTRLELGPKTVIWEASNRPAGEEESPKRVHLTEGVLALDVVRQPKPMTLVTPHGEARVLGTSFVLQVEPNSTRVEMKEGKIRLTRKEDGAAVEVGAGQFVVVAKGVPLEAKPMVPSVDKAPRNSPYKK